MGVTASACSLARVAVPANSKIKSIKELKGTTWASKKGTSENFAVRAYILPKNGLKDNDFNWLSINTTERIAALKTGTAQIASVSDPAGEIAVQAGHIRILTELCPFDNTRLMHIANPKTLREHPDLYEKYFRGWLKAHQLLKTNPEKYAKVYTEALNEIGQKAKFKVILSVVKRLRSEPFITAEVKSYLKDMAQKQKKWDGSRKFPLSMEPLTIPSSARWRPK